MAHLDLNYFTCTLGQAATLRKEDDGNQNSFKTILSLIETQAKRLPGHPALGLANYKSNISPHWPLDQVTFSEICSLSKIAAAKLAKALDIEARNDESPVVGISCASNLEFVLTWLGLMRLGCKPFLLAPQLDCRALEHLCKNSGIKTILIDESQEKRGTQFKGGINIIKIPLFQEARSPYDGYFDQNSYLDTECDIAYFLHSSGTSSGVPKPMPQTQWGAVGCLPCFPRINQPATFTTTPLYHGGLADCFRAWTSGAMIWLFPEGVVPVTGANVVRSVAYASERSSVPVKYFSSVPYVLQLLAEDNEGVRMLQDMDLVGVGGAALAASIGDKLVERGVKLVSRMGSAECGFLMSSHRDYVQDKEWQYLRPIDDSTLLSFEPRESGLSELVVKPNWPLTTITNRDDGSYATSDLFEPHPSLKNAWRYHSRADAQITLANGKKFDPSPLEESIKTSSPLVRDVLIFGAGKDYAGALLFKTSNESSDEGVIEAVWPQVQKLNKETQSHCRLTKSMLIAIEPEGEEPLPKSSKGSILRHQAEARYADAIERSYSGGGITPINNQVVSDADLSTFVLDLFTQVLGREIDPRGDVFQQGVDSIACIQIRKRIESHIFPERSPKLPLNIIYDNGNVITLVENLIRTRNGKSLCDSDGSVDELELMQQLADKYSEFETYNVGSHKKDRDVVVLTGATGALGAHMLSALCNDARVRKVYCLVRSRTKLGAKKRVLNALSDRGLPRPHGLDISQVTDDKVVCLPYRVAEAHLGLPDQEWTYIVAEATVFIHAAWPVNFSLRLSSFEDHIAGTRNVIDMAVSSSARCFFISSTAAVSADPSSVIAEKASLDPSHASALGYSRSKWVAERVCARAHERLFRDSSTRPSMSTDISVIRVGQLCGNQAGVWNATEAYPLMLSTASLVQCLPELSHETLNWLPVDQAAKIILEIALPENEPLKALASSEIPIYHVLNPHRSPTWNQLLQWVSETPEDPSFQVVQPAEWLRQLESSFSGSQARHPSQALLGLWRQRYTDATIPSEQKDERRYTNTPEYPIFDIVSSLRLSQTMRNIRPLSHDRVMRMWSWIQENMTMRDDAQHLIT
ncbi:acetyl-CoA synthetase-like protein [Annulohypoxylon truncatum]|uniref:acetyl-CoA synthetase-like protein n=1 Tax=Annulohypoxylon truncatum TaxID=327061 RepID=UPI0020077E99|nr:acetyl-CoA synthetase-like protein [Annulohypoxylon truncatum]KAI1208037.1 acetyl-CoA synthetase-like protein [Annulohypoxylon truncatum]